MNRLFLRAGALFFFFFTGDCVDLTQTIWQFDLTVWYILPQSHTHTQWVHDLGSVAPSFIRCFSRFKGVCVCGLDTTLLGGVRNTQVMFITLITALRESVETVRSWRDVTWLWTRLCVQIFCLRWEITGSSMRSGVIISCVTVRADLHSNACKRVSERARAVRGRSH